MSGVFVTAGAKPLADMCAIHFSQQPQLGSLKTVMGIFVWARRRAAANAAGMAAASRENSERRERRSA